MNAASDLETMELAKGYEPRMATPTKESIGSSSPTRNDEFEQPTKEELSTLRRVSGQILWTAYTVAFVELCEQFSYYGTTVVFVNFIQQPLPEGSTTGAGFSGQPGALDIGQRASTGLTTFNAFWAYIMLLLGAYIADQYWGRFRTIQISPLGCNSFHTVGFSEIMASATSLEYAFTKHEMAGAALELVPSLRGYINQNFSPFH